MCDNMHNSEVANECEMIMLITLKTNLIRRTNRIDSTKGGRYRGSGGRRGGEGGQIYRKRHGGFARR